MELPVLNTCKRSLQGWDTTDDPRIGNPYAQLIRGEGVKLRRPSLCLDMTCKRSITRKSLNFRSGDRQRLKEFNIDILYILLLKA